MMQRTVLQYAVRVKFSSDVSRVARASVWVIQLKIYMNHIAAFKY